MLVAAPLNSAMTSQRVCEGGINMAADGTTTVRARVPARTRAQARSGGYEQPVTTARFSDIGAQGSRRPWARDIICGPHSTGR